MKRFELQPRSDIEGTANETNGASDWITPELIQRTLEIWQPYYADRLTSEDALAIIKNVGVLFESLARGNER